MRAPHLRLAMSVTRQGGKQEQDLADMLKRMEARLESIEQHVRIPTWKKIVYGLGLTFLTASTVRYWIGKADPPEYAPLPCITSSWEEYIGQQKGQEGSYGR